MSLAGRIDHAIRGRVPGPRRVASGAPGALAAPPGRTRFGGRGCLLAPGLVLAAGTARGEAAGLALPSGLDATRHELFLEPQPGGEVWVRARYLVPAIARDGGAAGYDDVADDFVHLCNTDVIPTLYRHGQTATQAVVTLSDRPVEFGASDPDATQFFEAFRIEGSTCIWEEF